MQGWKQVEQKHPAVVAAAAAAGLGFVDTDHDVTVVGQVRLVAAQSSWLRSRHDRGMRQESRAS